MGILIATNIFWLRTELKMLSNIGIERKAILTTIKNAYPKLPPRVIFYTESDKSFYGMPDDEKIFPFQINFGYTLMVWYWPENNFPAEFANQSKFLYSLTEEGYKEVAARGVGYFRNFLPLMEAIKNNHLSPESVIAYRYHSSTKTVEDITLSTRSIIQKALNSQK